jgi:hypothetical protein
MMTSTTTLETVTQACGRVAAGLVLLAGLLGIVGCESKAAPQSTAVAGAALRTAQDATGTPSAALQAAARKDHYLVVVPGGALRVPAKDWAPMENKYAWAENFEARRKDPRQVFSRVVTVYKLPMTDSDRLGAVQISPTEHLELYVTDPGILTATVRVHKGAYWLLSRERFISPGDPFRFLPTSQAKSIYDAGLIAFQKEINTARYVLQTFGVGE